MQSIQNRLLKSGLRRSIALGVVQGCGAGWLSFGMLHIHSVLPGSPAVDHARTLFHAYREFLVSAASTHCFNFSLFAEEIGSLPGPYSGPNGELLVATVEEQPAGCIAYRHAAQEPETTCEIKRLFVQPGFRSQGLARRLVTEALTRASAREYSRAILDTDIASIAAAHELYVALGFTHYSQPGNHPPSLRFLERSLP